jgi:hypothetical protein
MGYDDPIAGLYQANDVMRRFSGCLILGMDGNMLCIFNKRITSDGYDDQFSIGHIYLPPTRIPYHIMFAT